MTTPQPRHAIDAAEEIASIAGSLRLAFEQDAAAIIAAHPDPELARLEHENSALITQADRLRADLERAVEQRDGLHERHNRNAVYCEELRTTCTQLRARVAELEAQLAGESKDVRNCDAIIDGLHAQISKLEQQLHALRLVCGTTDANKFETALDRANEKIKKLEADKARLDWLETGQHETVFLSRYDGGTEFWIKGYLHLGVFLTLRAAIDAARTAQPAANTGDNRRKEDES